MPTAIYVTPKIANLIDGKCGAVGFPAAEAITITDRYMILHLMVVSLTEETKPARARPDMERMEGLDEAWVMCFRRPRPGWRLLGRFYDVSQFIALRAYDRLALGRRADYQARATEMIADWETLFPAIDPHRAETVEEYIFGVVRDVSK